jgi:protein ImuB
VRRAEAAAPRIVAPGGCAAYLAAAPLALIPMDEELREALTALGLRTAGAFAALDATEVERRWGAEGLASWRLANGDDARRPVLARTDATRFVSTELAMSAATMEPVLFIVRAALGQLVDALVKDGRAAAAIAITLTLDDGRGAIPAGLGDPHGARPGSSPAQPHTVTREVRPAAPLARVAPLFERCRALLDQWTLAAPVSAVTVTVTATAPLGAEQGDLLAASWRDPAAADAAFERLRSTLGTGSVVRPVARDEHRPEKAGAWSELHEPSASSIPSPRTEPQHPAPAPLTPHQPCTPTRLFETPERVEVEAPRNTPRTMWWRGQRISIVHAAGPERLSGDWWKDPYARDYWRCESDELARDFLLYRDADGWRLQGWYD